jgi:hypothetical protein
VVGVDSPSSVESGGDGDKDGQGIKELLRCQVLLLIRERSNVSTNSFYMHIRRFR